MRALAVRVSSYSCCLLCYILISATIPDVVSPQTAQPGSPAHVLLPNASTSLKFAVAGNSGSGTREQFELAAQMEKLHGTFPFELVLLVGGNLDGSERPQDYLKKFEQPYQPLLEAKVTFYATLGNQDDRSQRYYKHFNMGGREYYSFRAPKQNVRFFGIDSVYVSPEQLRWIDRELGGSTEDWKIAFFYHPLYSVTKRGGPNRELQQSLEPLFVKHQISAVFNGRDHVYARLKPQQGIAYFVIGSSGRVDSADLDTESRLIERGFAADQAFIACEINQDELHFNVISRTGQVVDSGIVKRRAALAQQTR